MNKDKTIYIGADHGGYEAKEEIKPWLVDQGYVVEDVGPHSFEDADDYPQYAFNVAKDVAGDLGNSRGVLLCRTGEGMDIVANKVKGIRAAVGLTEELAKKSRQHNDANVITLAADYQSIDEIKKILLMWLSTEFPEENGERHERRVHQIEEIERETMK